MTRTLCIPMLILALCAGGCTLAKPLSRHAVSYNLAVESAQNGMLFLNVLRASQRMPMYFTDIGGITAGIGYDLKGGSLSLVEGSSDSQTFGLPQVTYKNNPTMEVRVRDDQEFMRGTLAQINPRTLGYFLEQGWNQELLLHLLVERVRLPRTTFFVLRWVIGLDGSDGKACAEVPGSEADFVIVENDPENQAHYSCFSALLRAFERYECRLDLSTRPAGDPIGYTGETSSVSEILKAREAHLELLGTGSEADRRASDGSYG